MDSRPLPEREKQDWLRLARTDRVGPVTFANLIARFGTAGAALDAIPAMARRGGEKSFTLPPPDLARREMEQLAAMGARLICACEPDFPSGLAALDPPPPVIAALGHPHLLQKEMVAIVGARNASALARKFTETLARDLGFAGLIVASGLARGIDAAAHQAALAVGTVAVVAGGVDTIYPPENAPLYEAIREQGVIISEVPLGEAPQARHFPRRNRLISGLARGVVVVEAAARSGSLITARYALEQGREVFAVPGSPLDPRAAGPNRLIRDGATLIQGADDVMAVLAPMLGGVFHEPGHMMEGALSSPPLESSPAESGKTHALIEEALGPAPVDIDDVIRQTGAPPGAVHIAILELELAGRCKRLAGNRIAWA